MKGITGFVLFLRIPALLILPPLIGTAGFMLVEGWGFADALYMAVTTITTVGFREVHPPVARRPGVRRRALSG